MAPTLRTLIDQCTVVLIGAIACVGALALTAGITTPDPGTCTVIVSTSTDWQVRMDAGYYSDPTDGREALYSPACLTH